MTTNFGVKFDDLAIPIYFKWFSHDAFNILWCGKTLLE